MLPAPDEAAASFEPRARPALDDALALPRPRRRDATGSLDARRTPRFPGATLELDAAGQIVRSWQGAAAPALAPSSDAFAALGVDDSTPDAVRLQLLLASAIGAPAEAWPILAGDAPTTMYRRDGRSLVVACDPVIDDGAITGVVVFVLATADPRIEHEDPVESNRTCVAALALLDECEASLQHLRLDPTARSAVHRMFRAMHTIKGSTRGTRLQVIADLAHHAETAIELLRDGDEPRLPVVADLAESLRQLRTAIIAARPRDEVDDAMTELLRDCRPALVDLQVSTQRLAGGDRSAAEVISRAIDRIRLASERAAMPALQTQSAVAAEAVDRMACGDAIEPALIDEITLLDRQIELYAAVHREAAALDAGPSLLVTMRSWMDVPDHRESFSGLAELMRQAGIPSLRETITDDDPLSARLAAALLSDAQAMFEPGRPRDDAALGFERAQRDLRGALDQLADQSPGAELAPLRAIVERLAWVPLAPLARRLVRMARTLATDLGKTVAPEIEFADLVVAPDVARVTGEILIHAVRNALDHGLESPADRLAAGKPAGGRIDVAAYIVDDRLFITVRDDGRGIAVERIRRIAVERNLLTAPAAAAADQAQLLDLLFHPGFSTAPTVTSVSGRGIGMDVIRSLAEERGGSVAIVSTPSCGTELTIELPLSPR